MYRNVPEQCYIWVRLNQHLPRAPSYQRDRSLLFLRAAGPDVKLSRSGTIWYATKAKLQHLKTLLQFLVRDRHVKNLYCLVNLGMCLDFALMTKPVPFAL